MKRMRNLFKFISFSLVLMGQSVVCLELSKDVLAKLKDLATSTGKYIAGKADNVRKVLQMQLLDRLVRQGIVSYGDKEAIVRVGNELCEQEKEFLQKRRAKVKIALEELLNRSLDGKYVPNIYMLGSGGGYRAMFNIIGSLFGAGKLIDATIGVVGLSGSAWGIGFWMSQGLSIGEAKHTLIATIAQSSGLANVGYERAKLIAEALLIQYLLNMPISLVNFYGGLLASTFFGSRGNEQQWMRLSSQQERIKNGDLPLPIYTTITSEKVAGGSGQKAEYKWYEYTPYEVGSAWLGLYVPSWGFGRFFSEGRSTTNNPEMSFGNMLAIFGSAFAATFKKIYKEVISKISLSFGQSIIERMFNLVGNVRISRGEIPNYTFGLSKSPIKDETIMKQIDAGIAFNIPYPPVSGEREERTADIIIIFDASQDLKGGVELKKVERYAREHKLKFPPINYENIDRRTISVFVDKEDPTVPAIIYMPQYKDEKSWMMYKKYRAEPGDEYVESLDSFSPKQCKKGACSTLNFKYSEEDARKLVMLAEFNMKENRQRIKEVFNWVIENRSVTKAP